MGNLEPFDSKQTKWEGLWWHPEYCGFSSAIINLADLRKFKGNVRLYVRKNKFFNNGENDRPNYHFCIKDANADIFNSLEIEDSVNIISKVKELAELMREGKSNGYMAALPSESQQRARDLMHEAIGIIEEITGEEWDFSFVTY